MYKLAGIKGGFALRWITLSIIFSILLTSFSTEVFKVVVKHNRDTVFNSFPQDLAIEDSTHSTTSKFFYDNENNRLLTLVVGIAESESDVKLVIAQEPQEINVTRTSRFSGLQLRVVASAEHTYAVSIDVRDKFFKRASIVKRRSSQFNAFTATHKRQEFLTPYAEGYKLKVDTVAFGRLLVESKDFLRRPKLKVLLC